MSKIRGVPDVSNARARATHYTKIVVLGKSFAYNTSIKGSALRASWYEPISSNNSSKSSVHFRDVCEHKHEKKDITCLEGRKREKQ